MVPLVLAVPTWWWSMRINRVNDHSRPYGIIVPIGGSHYGSSGSGTAMLVGPTGTGTGT